MLWFVDMVDTHSASAGTSASHSADENPEFVFRRIVSKSDAQPYRYLKVRM